MIVEQNQHIGTCTAFIPNQNASSTLDEKFFSSFEMLHQLWFKWRWHFLALIYASPFSLTKSPNITSLDLL